MNWGPSGDIDVSGYDFEADDDEEEKPSSNYGLRGSTFEKQSEANEKWKAAYCQAEKRAAVWEQRMKERTGPAREKAKERYAEAKAASAKACPEFRQSPSLLESRLGRRLKLGARRLPTGFIATTLLKMKMSTKKCCKQPTVGILCMK